MAKSVYIHAGAHRTGTSSFQLCLYRNRAALAEQGFDVAYPGRDGVPEGRLRLKLPRPRTGAKRIPNAARDAARHLAGLSPAADRSLILSEENIAGAMMHFYTGQFYPASAKRFETLARALETPPEHILFVLRPYGDLFASAYRNRSRDRAMPAFAELVPKFTDMDRGWPELLAQMRDFLRPRRLTVVPYATRGASRDLLARLVPQLEAGALAEPAETVNQSASDAALNLLQARYHAGEEVDEAERLKIIAEHDGDRVSRGFADYTDVDAARLTTWYEADLERIAGMDGLTLATQPPTDPGPGFLRDAGAGATPEPVETPPRPVSRMRQVMRSLFS